MQSFLILALILPAFFLSSCGKKGPPTLKSFKNIPSPAYERDLQKNAARSDIEIRNEIPSSGELAVGSRESTPSVPEGLRYFAAPDRVFLFWRGPEETWVRGFRIYRRMNGMEYRVIAETQIPSYIDTGSPGVPRDYRITTLGPQKESPAIELTVDFIRDR